MTDARVRWLGYAGLLPFVACAGAAHAPHPAAALALQALAAYAAVIVSFLGGIHWGFGFVHRASGWAPYAWGVTPSLLAWSALVLPVGQGLLLLAATLVLALAVDRRTYPRYGASAWLGLRLQLTTVAGLSCLVGAWAS